MLSKHTCTHTGAYAYTLACTQAGVNNNIVYYLSFFFYIFSSFLSPGLNIIINLVINVYYAHAPMHTHRKY